MINIHPAWFVLIAVILIVGWSICAINKSDRKHWYDYYNEIEKFKADSGIDFPAKGYDEDWVGGDE